MAETFVVRFMNVGRNRLNWEERIARPITTHAIEGAVRRKKALLSREIEATETGDYGGHIYAGLRNVGSYVIVPGSNRESDERSTR